MEILFSIRYKERNRASKEKMEQTKSVIEIILVLVPSALRNRNERRKWVIMAIFLFRNIFLCFQSTALATEWHNFDATSQRLRCSSKSADKILSPVYRQWNSSRSAEEKERYWVNRKRLAAEEISALHFVKPNDWRAWFEEIQLTRTMRQTRIDFPPLPSLISCVTYFLRTIENADIFHR